jgi:hypothetical protein
MEAIADETSSSTRLKARDFFIWKQFIQKPSSEKIFSQGLSAQNTFLKSVKIRWKKIEKPLEKKYNPQGWKMGRKERQRCKMLF